MRACSGRTRVACAEQRGSDNGRKCARPARWPGAEIVDYSKSPGLGRFLTMLSSYTLMLPGKHPSLRALPVELANARASMAMITLKNRTLSQLAEVFIKTARAVAKPLAKTR